jgi:deazaflavin-dependent oxidoreductase (nitroreductase family)
MQITFQGKKSGKTYTLPVNYAEDGLSVYVIPGWAEKKTWWHNIKFDTPVTVTLHGNTYAARADLLTPQSDKSKIVDGLNIYFHKIPKSASLHKISRSPDGQFSKDDIERDAGETIMVVITLPVL